MIHGTLVADIIAKLHAAGYRLEAQDIYIIQNHTAPASINSIVNTLTATGANLQVYLRKENYCGKNNFLAILEHPYPISLAKVLTSFAKAGLFIGNNGLTNFEIILHGQTTIMTRIPQNKVDIPALWAILAKYPLAHQYLTQFAFDRFIAGPANLTELDHYLKQLKERTENQSTAGATIYPAAAAAHFFSQQSLASEQNDRAHQTFNTSRP